MPICPNSCSYNDTSSVAEYGIKAQYTATTTWSRNFDKISIVTTNKNDNIPCKAISDSMVAHLENVIFVRRCGIKH